VYKWYGIIGACGAVLVITSLPVCQYHPNSLCSLGLYIFDLDDYGMYHSGPNRLNPSSPTESTATLMITTMSRKPYRSFDRSFPNSSDEGTTLETA